MHSAGLRELAPAPHFVRMAHSLPLTFAQAWAKGPRRDGTVGCTQGVEQGWFCLGGMAFSSLLYSMRARALCADADLRALCFYNCSPGWAGRHCTF
jgi:hypothetical protein